MSKILIFILISVLTKTSGAYRWEWSLADPEKRCSDIVQGGIDAESKFLYVARFHHYSNLLPGEVQAEGILAYSNLDGKSQSSLEFEVLCGQDIAWQQVFPQNETQLPDSMIQVGYLSDSKKLYSCRGIVEEIGSMLIGYIDPYTLHCSLTNNIDNKLYQSDQYEVLIQAPSNFSKQEDKFRWLWINGGITPCPGITAIGGMVSTLNDFDRTFICRVYDGKTLSPATDKEGWTGATITYFNSESKFQVVDRGEVLCGFGLGWQPVKINETEGVFPPAALPVGYNQNGTYIYACRVFHDGTFKQIALGQVFPEDTQCYYSYETDTQFYLNITGTYEVLIKIPTTNISDTDVPEKVKYIDEDDYTIQKLRD